MARRPQPPQVPRVVTGDDVPAAAMSAKALSDAFPAWMFGSAIAAQAAVDGMEQLLRWNLQGASAWTQALVFGAHEMEQATDPTALMAVPSHVLSQQLEDLGNYLGDVLQEMLDTQRRWAQLWQRSGATSSAAHGAPDAVRAPASAAPGTTRNGLEQVQQEWFAATQRGWDSAHALAVQRAGI